MKIIKGVPPNFDKLNKKFHITDGAVFTYGDRLFIPSGRRPSVDLIAHETVHSQRQQNPKKWWNKYLKDPKFRLDEELVAYRAQYQVFKKVHKDPNQRVNFLTKVAGDLSSPLYGSIISFQKAMEEIAGDDLKKTAKSDKT